MISNNAAYGAGTQAQLANQFTTPDQGPLAYGSSFSLLDRDFTPAATRRPVIPAQAPVMIEPTMPQGTPLSMPSIVNTATTYLPPSRSALQPSDLLHPLPSIVNTAPVPIINPCAGTLEQWVSDNPMLAIAGLGVLAYYLLGRK